MIESLEILHKRRSFFKKILISGAIKNRIPTGDEMADLNNPNNEVVVKDLSVFFDDCEGTVVLKKAIERLQSLDDMLIPLPLDNTPTGISFNTNMLNEPEDDSYDRHSGAISIQYANASAIGIPRLNNHELQLVSRSGMELGTNVANIS